MEEKVSIIILNWNSIADTIECLNSLKEIEYSNFEIIIVDNNSSGNDVQIIQSKFGSFIKRVIVNQENLGFSGGNNGGIKIALQDNPEYILLLNNDTIVQKDFLNHLLKGYKKYPDVAIAVPVIKYYDRKNIIWSAGGYIDKLRGSGYSYLKDKNDHLLIANRFCSFVSGCCMLIKYDVFTQVGLFDDDFFLYLEDVDLSYRVTEANMKNLLVKDSVVYHKVNSASKKDFSTLPLYYNVRNRLLFSKKHLGFYFYIVYVYMFIGFGFKSIIKFNDTSFRKVVKRAFSDFRNKSFGKINPLELKNENNH